MNQFIDLKSLEQAKKELEGLESFEKTLFHLGAFQIDEDYKSTDAYAILKYVYENHCPPMKLVKWGEFEQERQQEKWAMFNGLKNESPCYHKFLPHGYTCKPEGRMYKDFNQSVIAGMDTKNDNDEWIDLEDLCEWDEDHNTDGTVSDAERLSLHSMYYHSAKAHWLVQSIREEGLWAPIQGQVVEIASNRYQLRIHPGSVRSGVFEEMGDPNMELCILDKYDAITGGKVLSVDELLEYWKEKLDARKDDYKDMSSHYNVSFTLIQGALEYNTNLMNVGDFRPKVYEFNKKVHKLSKGKPFNIYIGYDSRHGNLADISKLSIEDAIFRGTGNGHLIDQIRFQPEIKILDIAKIPEYTREYANQSTEFTYSRFLIPYLENYEGFSMFIDNDFLFKGSLLPMFYYLNPDDAVACIQYPQYKHDETKFKGEVNIDYPRKLWSSLMIFNNGHEDCKKLTPDAVNTWTGKQLHQFEWTEKISPIPERYIFVEGYDDPEVKWDWNGIHYTRGGPWVEGMDCGHINNLDLYYKWKIMA